MPASFNTKAFMASLTDLEAGIRNASIQAMRASVQTAQASAKATTLYNDRTGALRQNTVGTADGLTGKLVANTKYARYVENGRAITTGSGGRRKRAVVFVRNGTKSQAATTSGRPFMAIAGEAGRAALERNLASFVDYAITKSR